MMVKHKLLVGLVLLATVPMLVSISIATWVAGDSSNQLLAAKTQEKLIDIRDAKKQQIEDRFVQIKNQIVSFSQRETIGNAMLDFEEGFIDYPNEAKNISANEKISASEARDFVTTYYQQQKQNSATQFAMAGDQLSDSTALLQYYYIVNNRHEPGEKQKLDRALDSTLYSTTHGQMHPIFLEYLNEKKIEDIYLISLETNSIIYSVKKDADFGLLLSNSKHAEGAISKAFKGVKEMPDKNPVFVTDYQAYPASSNQSSIFIAAKINYLGAPIGVLVFQLTANFVDSVMGNKQNWKKAGLGRTGDTYLIGTDRTMRSTGRTMAENSEDHLASLQASGMKEESLIAIRDTGSTIGLQTIDTISVEQAQKGQTGFTRFVNTDGEGVLSAYAPISVEGLEWSVIAEMKESEAHAPSASLLHRLITYSAVTAIAMTVIAVLCGWLLAMRLVNPVERLAREIGEIESNSNLSFKLTSNPTDITIDIVDSMNKMLQKIHSIVSKVAGKSDELSEAAASIDKISTRTFKEVEKQEDQTNNIAAAISKMKDTVQRMASNAEDASKAALAANEHADSGRNIVDATARSVGKLDDEVNRAAEVIENLSKNSANVGNVLNVISSIADQTNLLALNAAIEAARAGEQGRGFAVVADEVRSLASRTQDSTGEIKTIVGTLNDCAEDAVEAMNNGREQGEKSVSRAEQTNGALVNIVESISQVATLNQQIAEESAEQLEASESINQRISVIKEIAKSNTEDAEATRQTSDKINQLAIDLKSAVAQFNL